MHHVGLNTECLYHGTYVTVYLSFDGTSHQFDELKVTEI